MEIITGMTGKPHVTAAQHRKIIRAITGEYEDLATYVADFGEKMEMELLNNKVRIKSGMLIHHGCVGEIPEGTYDEVEYEPGEIGKYRTDILVAKYEKNPVNGLEKFDWDVIKGEPSDEYPGDYPTVEETDLTNGALIDMTIAAVIRHDGLSPALEKIIATRREFEEEVIKQKIAISAYPIGAIFITTAKESPSQIFGYGKWERWGVGRVPVGVDERQEEFKTAEKTGGEKEHYLTEEEMPRHEHGMKYLTEMVSNASGTSRMAVVEMGHREDLIGGTAKSEQVGGNEALNNMPPYITCYFWKRVG